MTDEADRSDEKIAAAIAEGIDRARRQSGLAFTGACYYCADTLAEPLRFCSTDCRDDYDTEQRLRRLGGR